MQLSFNAYSVAKAAGYLKHSNEPIRFTQAKDLLLFAKANGFISLEIPLDYYFDRLDSTEAREFFDCAYRESVEIFPCIEDFSVNYLRQNAPEFAGRNMQVIRIKMPHLGKTFYGGNRYSSNHFETSLSVFSQQLDEVDPLLDDLDLFVAIENHQDLDLVDLVKLCETSKRKRRRITWDVGNSLATMRTPLTFLQGSRDWIANVHLKDYFVAWNERQLILKRCILGDGFLNPGEVFGLLRDLPALKNVSMEIAAHIDRKADLFEPQYPLHYDLSKSEIEDFLGFIEKEVKPSKEQESVSIPFILKNIEDEVSEAYVSSKTFLENADAIR